MIRNQLERWWNKVEQRHERSGIGSLITPTDIYVSPSELAGKIAALPGLDMDQLGAIDVLDDDVNPMDEISFSSRPTLRFHGSIPAFLQQIKTLAEQQTRMLLVAPNHGEVERLAGLLREYGQPYRLGSRAQAPGAEQAYDESSHLAGDFVPPCWCRAPSRAASACRIATWCYLGPMTSPTRRMSRRGLCRASPSQKQRPSSPTSATSR